MMTRKSKIQNCYDCTKFKLTCDGEKEFELVPPKITCQDLDRGSLETPNKIQVKAFQQRHMLKIKRNVDPLTAFVEAIVETSDDVFANAEKHRNHLIEKYNNLRKEKRNESTKIAKVQVS